jgi:hypothetical protein
MEMDHGHGFEYRAHQAEDGQERTDFRLVQRFLGRTCSDSTGLEDCATSSRQKNHLEGGDEGMSKRLSLTIYLIAMIVVALDVFVWRPLPY